jgi:hypothetical protein
LRINCSQAVALASADPEPLLVWELRSYTADVTVKKVCLRAVMVIRNGKRCWSGEYECSICGVHFCPDPNDGGKLTREFEEHAVREHGQEMK